MKNHTIVTDMPIYFAALTKVLGTMEKDLYIAYALTSTERNMG